MNKDSLRRPLSFWVELLKDGILLPEVDAGTASALCCHLADLGAFKKTGEEEWELIPLSEIPVNINEEVDKLLKELCATEQGFALRYFLKEPPGAAGANGTQDSAPSEAGDNTEKNAQLLERTTSNLSNLQIVKKYGRQMESFIELEKDYTDKLMGSHTSSKEARKIFNFILSRMKQKTKPQPWEQLSRRRHK